MPTIICDYCLYVGSGEDYEARIQDVEAHEETCPERPALEKEDEGFTHIIKHITALEIEEAEAEEYE